MKCFLAELYLNTVWPVIDTVLPLQYQPETRVGVRGVTRHFFQGGVGGTHMTGMGSERKGAGKATHYICLLFVPLILPQQWQYDSRCPFPPFQSKKPEQEAELRSWKTCNMQQCDDQAGNDLKVVGRCSRLQQYGQTPFPYIVSLAFHLHVLIKTHFMTFQIPAIGIVPRALHAFELETCYIWHNKSCTTAPWQFSREMVQWSGPCIESNWSIFHGLDKCYDVQV